MSDRGAVLSDIASWLHQHGLGLLSEVFEANHIDLSTLPDLTEQDFRDLGLSVGHRRKLVQAIRSLETAPPAEAERRQITVLFVDIVGYTLLARRLDPEELLDTMRVYHAACGRIVGLHGGSVIEYVGDGVVALFGWPVASEHDARSAVLSGLDIQKEIEKLKLVNSGRLQARIGIATGLSLVGDLGREGARVMGDVPNLASRLQGAAEPGQVIISETTMRLVETSVACTPLGETTLKGFDEPVRAWRAEGPRRHKGTRATEGAASLPLLGRAGEMERLQATWAEVAAGGHRTLYLRGQAGIGKSRIMAEFAASIAEEARIIRFFASPDAMQSPLRPIIDELEALAGFRTSDTAAERDGRLSDLLRSAALDDPAFFAIFAEALGLPGADTHDATALSPERRKAMLFEGLGRIVLDRAGGRPLAVIFEDLHWLDPASLEFARHLASVMADTRSMLLGTVRPEGELIWQAATPPPVTVELDRLEDADAIELLRLQGRVSGALDEEAIRGILERADGVPLYLEELTKSAAESRSETAIPFTLQEALMARLDRLGQAKRITQMAAVIGRDFTASLLGAVLALPPALVAEPLDRLVEEQILSREDNGAAGAEVYRFRHMLLAEAAYESQLRSKRREAHGDIADVLQSVFPEEAQTAPEFVARHLMAGGRPAEAVPLFRGAGLSAMQRAHYQEAEGLLRAALDALQEAASGGMIDAVQGRQTRLEIFTELGTALIALRGFGAPEVGEVFSRAESLGRDIGPSLALARALWGAWLYNLVSGNLAHAELLARELLTLGDGTRAATGDSGLYMEAHWALGDTLFWRGKLAAADLCLEEGLRLFDPASHGDHAVLFGQDPCVAAHCYRAATCWALSEHNATRQSLRAAFRRAQSLEHPFSTAWALSFGPLIAAWREEPRTVLRLSSVALKHTEHQIVPFWQSAMTVLQGWARLRCGGVAEGREIAQQGLAFYEGIGSKTVQPYFRGLVAECQRISGDHAAAEAMIRQAIDQARDTGELISEIWLHIFDARLRRDGGSGPAAAALLEEAITMARNTGAVELELTAALELGEITEDLGPAASALARSVDPGKSTIGRRALARIR